MCGLICPQPSVTVGMPCREVQLASRPPLATASTVRVRPRARPPRQPHTGRIGRQQKRLVVHPTCSPPRCPLFPATFFTFWPPAGKPCRSRPRCAGETPHRDCALPHADARDRSRHSSHRPPAITPTLLVPCLRPFRTRPCQPFSCRSAIARLAIAMALTPRSGATPAWLASPVTSISIRHPPVAPTVTFSGGPPSQLKASFGPPNKRRSTQREPCRPISSCTNQQKVNGGCGSPRSQDLHGRRQDRGHPGPVVGPHARARIRRPDDARFHDRAGSPHRLAPCRDGH